MSFFEKIVFKTFLILALICFCISSAFADTTYYYYRTIETPQFCNVDKGKVCASGKPATFPADCESPSVSCDPNTEGNFLHKTTCTNSDGSTYPREISSFNKYTKQSKICKDGEKFVLDGCTASCVVDPCKQLQGLQFTKSDVQCGTASCPSGSVFDGSASGMYCKPSKGLISPAPAQSAVDPATACAGTLDNVAPSSFKIKSSAIGSSSATLYCTATYINSGSSSLVSPDETGLASISFMDVTETTEDGPCPPNTTKGSYALGDGTTKWICVKDSGSEPDPTDPNPTTCPTGQHKDATGQCVPDTTPPPDSDGDGTPDSEDDSPNGGGGGSNCNAQTGLGCNNPNPDSDTDGDGIPDKDDSMTDSDGDGDADKGDYYSDNCEKTPNCTADPVQCAILRNQWKANCEANRPMSQGEKDLVSSALSKQETENATASSEFSNKVNQIINDNALFSTSTSTTVACIPDKQVPIFGSFSVTVKYSLLCPYFSLLRNMLILVAYMFAARIVYAEVTGGGIRV